MGKTGSTHLQTDVFPELEKLGIIHYHSDWVNSNWIHKEKERRARRAIFNQTNQEKIDFGLDAYSDDSVHLISHESILSWDPREWKTSIAHLLNDYGDESEILVTLRDPYSYLRSIYQQMIQQGESDLTPYHFFLKLDLYDKHRGYFGKSNSTRRFSIDELDYNYLYNLISEKYDRVYFSDMSTTMSYKFLVDMNIIDTSLCKRLQEKKPTISNLGYSKKAMLWDIKRFKIFHSMNLIPLSSSIESRNRIEKLISDQLDSDMNNRTISKAKNSVSKTLEKFKRLIRSFGIISKLLKLPYKIIILPHALIMNWRYFLQNYVNVLFKYEKFQLPPKLYLGKHIKDNMKFYNDLPLSKGYDSDT
jgi:hypothetical protein